MRAAGTGAREAGRGRLSADELARLRIAGRIVGQVLERVRRAARPGVATAELDAIAEEEAVRRGARPAFKGYHGFPGCLCVSLNDEVVHGIPSATRRLVAGDLLKLDFAAAYEGLHADAAITVPVGPVEERAGRLVKVARECLERGVARAVEGGRIGDIGAAVQQWAESQGFSVVREFVGHGIGRALHEAPAIPNFRSDGTQRTIEAGMVLAIEPMVNAGRAGIRVLDDGWTAVTRDRGLSAHFEHTVVVTAAGGPEVVTAG